jgi:hypothetical protein
MSKVQFILLAAFLGFYTVLFMTLIMRSLIEGVRARWSKAIPRIEKVSEKISAARSRAWTRAVWREKLAQGIERRETTATAAASPRSQALC